MSTRSKAEILISAVAMYLFIFVAIISIELAFGMLMMEFTNEDDLRIIGYMVMSLPVVYFPGEMCAHCVRVWVNKQMRRLNGKAR